MREWKDTGVDIVPYRLLTLCLPSPIFHTRLSSRGCCTSFRLYGLGAYPPQSLNDDRRLENVAVPHPVPVGLEEGSPQRIERGECAQNHRNGARIEWILGLMIGIVLFMLLLDPQYAHIKRIPEGPKLELIALQQNMFRKLLGKIGVQGVLNGPWPTLPTARSEEIQNKDCPARRKSIFPARLLHAGKLHGRALGAENS